jgi:hypothetical protein
MVKMDGRQALAAKIFQVPSHNCGILPKGVPFDPVRSQAHALSISTSQKWQACEQLVASLMADHARFKFIAYVLTILWHI